MVYQTENIRQKKQHREHKMGITTPGTPNENIQDGQNNRREHQTEEKKVD